MRLSKHLLRLALSVLLPLFSTLNHDIVQAQQNDPNLGDAQRLLKQGQPAQALNKIDTYLASKPKEAQGRFTKGLILTEMKRTGDAILVFKKLTEDFPDLPEPYNNLAVLYAQEKQYEKARQALEAAIKTHPAYAVAHENLGDIYAKLASQAYGKALQIDAGNTAAQSKMAMIRDLVPPTPAAVSKAAGKSAGDPIRIASMDPARLSYPAATASNAANSANAKPVIANAKPPVAAPAPAPVASAPVAAAPAIAAPAPAPPAIPVAKPTPKPMPAVGENDPAHALNAWVSAWSKKDVKSYLAAYAPNFQTPNGQARNAWERERESRINKPGKLEVSIDNVAVAMNGSDQANVTFRQHYRSATLKTATNKTVILARHNGRWLIQQERVK